MASFFRSRSTLVRAVEQRTDDAAHYREHALLAVADRDEAFREAAEWKARCGRAERERDAARATAQAPLRGLDDECSKCGRRVGDHTMDEFNACSSRPALDLPYERVADGPIPLTLNGEDIAWADHVHCRSAVMQGESFGTNLRVKLPTVIFTFEIGNPDGLPHPVAEVAFVSPPDVVRKLGKVIHSTCNGAANAAERSA